jgi:type I restriction enzyme S subunit
VRELPPGWAWATLNDACDIVQGQSPPGATYNALGVGVPFFQGKSEFGELHPTVKKWCTAPTKVADAGDILISIRAPVGPTNVANCRCCIGRGLAALRSRRGIDQFYVLYHLRYSESDLASAASGSTFGAISGVQLGRHPIPLPPLDEQRRIVAEIERQMTTSLKADQAISAAKTRMTRMFASAIRSALEDVWSGPEVSRPRTGWTWMKFGDVLESLRNGIPAKPDSDSGQPILKISAVRPMEVRLGERRFLEPSQDWKTYELRFGDLLFTRYNGNPELVGVCAAVPEIEETLLYPDKLIRARLKPGFYPAYFEIALNYGNGRRWLQSRVRTTAGQCGISGGDLKEMPVPVPALEVQHAIADVIGSLASGLRRLDAELARISNCSARLRQSIFKSAFEGKLVPQDPNDEAASVLLERIRAARPSTARGRAIR